MPSKGARESIVRYQAPQVAQAPAARGTPRTNAPDSNDPAAHVLRILESVNQGLSRIPAGKPDAAAVFQNINQMPGQSRRPGQSGNPNSSSGMAVFDPHQLLEEMYGEEASKSGRATNGRQQILARCSKLLPKLLQHDSRSFNFYYPGMADHVDHPHTVIREYLHQVAAALMFGASSPELKKLKPLLERIHEKIQTLDRQSKPPQAAARPCRELSYRLGTLMPEHPMVMPVEAF